jgi:hypothetical protein
MVRSITLCLILVMGICSSSYASDLALGDSIAVGVGAALSIETVGKVGASSCAVLGYTPSGHHNRVVISAGVNDPPGRCDLAIRQKLRGSKVIWILPATTSARKNIENISRVFGDVTVSYIVGRDGIHPRSYQELAARILAAW